MARTCSICSHPQRAEIEACILDSTGYRNISKRFTVGLSALSRHRPHMQQAVAVAQRDKAEHHGAGVLDKLDDLSSRADRLMDDADLDGDLRARTAALHECWTQARYITERLISSDDIRKLQNVLAADAERQQVEADRDATMRWLTLDELKEMSDAMKVAEGVWALAIDRRATGAKPCRPPSWRELHPDEQAEVVTPWGTHVGAPASEAAEEVHIHVTYGEGNGEPEHEHIVYPKRPVADRVEVLDTAGGAKARLRQKIEGMAAAKRQDAGEVDP